MNIFEGSRRIAKVAAAFWAGAVIVKAFFDGAFDGRYDLWSEISRFLPTLITGPLVILAFTIATGWIVRGFLGIPSGKDQIVDQ
jgi:hypothetical protein